MLTFIVGATIVLTLIGRGELIGKVGQLPSPAQRVRNLQDAMQANLRAEEEGRRLRLIAEGKASENVQDSLDEDADDDDDDKPKKSGKQRKDEAEDKETEPAEEEK